jgi:uncharacterized protein (TIGR03067 family)
MKRLLLVVLAALLLPVGTRGEDAAGELAAIAGTWIPVEAELGGQKFPDEVLKTIELIIRDDTYEVHVGPQVDRGKIQLVPTLDPKGIDIIGTQGPNAGKTLLAIYQRTGDTLQICYDLQGKKRPTEFKTQQDTQYFLVRYRRETN